MALVTEFLTTIRSFVVALDGDGLSQWLQVEPGPAGQHYSLMREELRRGYGNKSHALESLVDNCLPEDDSPSEGSGSPWPSFVAFVKDYLLYWKDSEFDDLLGLQESLSGLLTSCSAALSHPAYGSVMFKTSISLSEALSKVAMMLNRRPDLLRKRRAVAGDDDGKSMVEQSAEVVQKIFMSCLSDRSSTRFAKPEGKKVGVYIIANLVLKLLFTCGKSRAAAQLLLNLSTNGPPLSLFPSSQRVTFLYYLGRFYFDASDFVRASHCLQEAYFQTPPSLQKHRKLILTYLIPSNILQGRFPSATLLSRPEAAQSGPIFLPITQAVRKGDFVAFQAALAAHERWLYRRGVLFPLMYRLRPLVWRSFTRRVFLLTYVPPTDGGSRLAPTLSFAHVVAAAARVQRLLEGWVPAPQQPQHLLQHHKRPSHTNAIYMRAVTNSADAAAPLLVSTLVPPPGRPRQLKPSEGLFWGNLPVTTQEVEGVVTSLIAQGLLHGFVAHSSGRLAITGAKQRGGPLAAGWPSVAGAIAERLSEDGVDVDEVPAWVKMPTGFA